MTRRPFAVALLAGLLATSSLVADDAKPTEQASESAFKSTTIDIGMVVSDVAKSQKFYEEVVGFAEVGAFTVPAEMGAHSGLSDNQPFDITVLALGEGETATKLKLMSFPKKPGARQDLRFIHSTLGVSYLTFHVTDLSAALDRAKQAGSKPVAKGITVVPFAPEISIALLRDPDGNFVELVGPAKK